MKKITFVIPSRNNLEFIKLAYKSIKDLIGDHDILILNDASTDGTLEWLESLNDDALLIHNNPGPERIGIVGMFDKGIALARTEIIMAFHSDMVASPKLDVNILKHLKPGTVVSATRVEPPLHPPGQEKVTMNFGMEVVDFVAKDWIAWCKNLPDEFSRTTEGIFAPWCMYKKDFLAVGGHDELFAPQSKEDSDLFNRFQLAGYKFVQPWDALVYHFTSRGSRFNKHSGGSTGNNSDEWLQTTTKNMKNFIRKWGHMVKHDEYMKPIIPPKYNIAIVVKNCTMEQVNLLEPWGDYIYVDCDYSEFVKSEQDNTIMDISKRIFPISAEVNSDIEIRVDGKTFTKYDQSYLFEIASIIEDNKIEEKDWGFSFRLGNLEIKINRVITCNIS